MLETVEWLERLWNQLHLKDRARAAVKLEEWKQEVIMDDETYTPGERKEDKDVKVYEPTLPEAVEEEEAKPEEIQPVAADDPAAQQGSDTEAVEPEKKPLRKWKEEELQKYVDMAAEGIKPKEIKKAMADELDIKLSNANTLYYNKVLPTHWEQDLKAKGIVEKPEYQGKEPAILKVTPEPEPVQVIAPAIVDKISPVTESKPKEPTKLHLEDGELKAFKDKTTGQSVAEIARECHVPQAIVEEIALMPAYDSAITFKDAVCVRESMNKNFSISELKKVYRATHIGTRW